MNELTEYAKYLPRNFRQTNHNHMRCGRCKFFPSIDNGCQKVKGLGNRYLIGYVLDPRKHVCDKWEYAWN